MNATSRQSSARAMRQQALVCELHTTAHRLDQLLFMPIFGEGNDFAEGQKEEEMDNTLSGPVDTLAVLDDAPSVTVRGVTVPHNTREWRVATNRHPCTGGAAWGWIEGAPGNVCWSNEKSFNREAAGQMVAAHSQWLEDQTPLSIRLVEARDRYMRAKVTHDNALAAYSKAYDYMIEAEDSLAALANVGGAK